MVKINKKEKVQYSMVSNIVYAFKKIWQWDKIYFLMYLPSQPLNILMSVIAIYIPKAIIDSIEKNRPIFQIILTVIILFTISFITERLFSYCRSVRNSRVYVISKRFELEIDERQMTTDFANTDNPDAQNKFQRAESNLMSIDFIFTHLARFIENILGIFTYGAIIITISPIIPAIIATSGLVVYFMGKHQIKYIDKHKDTTSGRNRKQWHLSNYSADFEYAKDVKLYKMTDWISDMLKKIKFESLKWNKTLNLHTCTMNNVNALFTLIRDGAAYIILIYMLLGNKITLGDFAFYFGAVTGFSSWLNNLAYFFNTIKKGSLAVGYCREYLDIKDLYNHGKGCDLPCDLPLEIEFKNVSYRYPNSEDHAIKNVNLKINKGEKLAIVGLNGAGKTTLVKLLCGYYYPTKGEIYVNRRSLPEYNLDEYQTMFAAVFQDIGLLPISIEEFISSRSAESGEIDGGRVKKVIEQAELDSKVASLSGGVKTLLMKSVYDGAVDFSGGEKQKLMFARALYKDAPCIILDEPTASLDPIAESNLYQKYNELTQNKTSLYISHRLASTKFCDRILYMENGEISEQGTHGELMAKNGKYADMFDLQSRYYKEAE